MVEMTSLHCHRLPRNVCVRAPAHSLLTVHSNKSPFNFIKFQVQGSTLGIVIHQEQVEYPYRALSTFSLLPVVSKQPSQPRPLKPHLLPATPPHNHTPCSQTPSQPRPSSHTLITTPLAATPHPSQPHPLTSLLWESCALSTAKTFMRDHLSVP